MNDRFWFRVWSYEQKRMINSWNYSSKRDFLYGALIDHRFFGNGLFITMQSTGLKDSSGTLIYEGDIVTYEWLTPIGKVWRDDGKCIVRWFGDGFNPIHNIAVYNVKDGTTRNVKVIGNIYENKELIDEH